MFTPAVRQWIYTVAAIGTAVIPLLVAYHVIDSTSAGAWVNVVGVLGAVGSGGLGLAGVMTNKLRRDGTLDFTGTAAEQAVAALQATVDQAAHAAENLDKVKAVVTSVVGSGSPAIKVIPGSLVEQLINASGGK
jgi:hypothetical protein